MLNTNTQQTLSQLCQDLPNWIEDMEVSQAYAFLEGDFGFQANRYFERAGYSASELLSDYGDEMLSFLASLFTDRSQTPFVNEHWYWDGLTWEQLCERIAFKAIDLKLSLLLFK